MRFTAYGQPHKHSPFPQFATYVEKYFIRDSVITFVVSLLRSLGWSKKRKKERKNKEKRLKRKKRLKIAKRLYVSRILRTYVSRYTVEETKPSNSGPSDSIPCTNVYNRSQCLDIKRRSRNVAMAGRAPTNEFSPKDSSFRERITHRKLNSERWRAAIKLQINYG